MRLSDVVVVTGVVVVGILGSWFTTQGMPWYNLAVKPPLTPPGEVIGLAWTIIYILSAAALIRWFRLPGRGSQFWLVVWLFIANGMLNWLWCLLFFYLRQPVWAVAEMLLLEATVVALIALMRRRSPVSAILLVPYALWVAFATYLAAAFWVVNR